MMGGEHSGFISFRLYLWHSRKSHCALCYGIRRSHFCGSRPPALPLPLPRYFYYRHYRCGLLPKASLAIIPLMGKVPPPAFSMLHKDMAAPPEISASPAIFLPILANSLMEVSSLSGLGGSRARSGKSTGRLSRCSSRPASSKNSLKNFRRMLTSAFERRAQVRRRPNLRRSAARPPRRNPWRTRSPLRPVMVRRCREQGDGAMRLIPLKIPARLEFPGNSEVLRRQAPVLPARGAGIALRLS